MIQKSKSSVSATTGQPAAFRENQEWWQEALSCAHVPGATLCPCRGKRCKWREGSLLCSSNSEKSTEMVKKHDGKEEEGRSQTDRAELPPDCSGNGILCAGGILRSQQLFH